MGTFFLVFLLTACAHEYRQMEIVHTKTGNVSSTYFKSVQLAAVNASIGYNYKSIIDNTEYIGGIIENEKGLFYFTVNKGRKNKSHSIAKIQLPSNHVLRAVWHTHAGKNQKSAFFSHIDTTLANRMKIPVYMIDSSRTLKVFKPGDKILTKFAAYDLGLGKFTGYAKGCDVKPLVQ